VKSSSFGLTALIVFSCAGLAHAGQIDDPALFQDGTGCATNTWCASINKGVADPKTGDTTLEFVFNAGTGSALTSLTSGWVAAVTGSTVDDLLDFEKIGSTYVVFLYCGDAHCSAYDLGLPTGITATTTYADGAVYSPVSPQPGFGTIGGPNGACNCDLFQIQDPAGSISGLGVTATPEPASVVLLGTGLLIAGAGIRRRQKRSRT
jgi:hypothetical protein